MNSEVRNCKNCQQSFEIQQDEFGFYEKLNVPPPTFCPACRLQRRLLFRNERNYYRRTCDLCKRSIISVYSAELPFPVYCQKCWWSDGWDPKAYGRDFDFSRTFSEQYKDLQNVAPAVSMMNDDGVASINCEYTYDWAFSKNCYLCFDSNNCVFGYDLKGCSNCVMCVGLRNKKYCILNKQYSKEEYEKEVEKMNLKSRASIEKCRREFD